MEDISEIKRALTTDKILEDFPSFKILGIKWNSLLDHFRIQIGGETFSGFSKRSFLPLVAKIFDLLGWIALVTILAKIIMQLF